MILCILLRLRDIELLILPYIPGFRLIFGVGSLSDKIIQSLSDESYMPKPVRRTYIPKKRGSHKMRPLGIPTFTDKLVQEVLRMILESVYEPIFSKNSHGFRPQRSCHTALNSLKKEFTGVGWFVEGDIKGCFDNINHHVLVDIIGRKIKDARLIKLVWKFLRAGYMEDWQYNGTYSGCPQGGIISPLLANIYLNELDKFAEETAERFYKARGNYSVTLRNPQFLHKVEKRNGSEKNQRNVNIQEAKKVVC